MDVEEVLLTTSRNAQQWSACLWDYSTGSALHYYKNGGAVSPKTLNVISNDFIMTSDEDKPMTHLWPLNSQEPDKKLTTILPGKASVLTVCPHSCYLAAGIGAKLYVWQLASGKLLAIQKKNFQPITCVKFSSDSAYITVAGQDGMLLVYDLESLVSLHNNYVAQSEGQVEPLYSKQDHSLPITDVFVGSFREKARIVTVSCDNTCKIYALATGRMLLNLVFEEALSAVVFDGPCWNLFVGRNSGKIQQFWLREPPRGVEHHVSGDLVFQGHQKRVSCLDLGIGNGVLVSGSDDNFVFIWEISSRQILRRIEHKGAITNVKCVLKNENFFSQNFKVTSVLTSLERDLVREDDFVIGKIQDFDIEMSDDEADGKERDSSSCNRDLKAENARLRAANKQLYDTTMLMCQKYHNFL